VNWQTALTDKIGELRFGARSSGDQIDSPPANALPRASPPVSTTLVAKHPCENTVEGYLWLPTSAARLPGFAQVDLFGKTADSPNPQLLRSSRSTASLEEHRQVLIRRSDVPRVSASVNSNLSTVLQDNRLPVTERFALLQVGAWHALEQYSRKQYGEQFAEVAQTVGRQIAALLDNSPVTAAQLYIESIHEDASPIHLTRVAGYAVLVAQEMGESDPQTLAKIAIGAMLHEFGKLFLPTELLNKLGRLTLDEREHLERAPILGYEKLCHRRDVEFGQLMMVYQQHERFDGSGYPVGVENDEIHPWARILSVVDVFDSVVSKRAYRRENRVSEALLYLCDNSSLQFDPQVVTCWIKIFQHN
jgi:HD-GYP domain-containing protein (c-di-GMP phosphodiesterase class II)